MADILTEAKAKISKIQQLIPKLAWHSEYIPRPRPKTSLEYNHA